MAYYPSASTCSRWTRPRSGGKTPALQRDLMRDADENFPAQIVHLVEFADIRDPILTWMYGESVGEDEFGNRYYRTRGGKVDKTLGFERRWVIYNGYTEASAVPPSWH